MVYEWGIIVSWEWGADKRAGTESRPCGLADTKARPYGLGAGTESRPYGLGDTESCP